VNTESLKHLAAVVDTGSFSEAAAKLGVSQPAVSLSIKKMEKDLGLSLLTRTPSGYRPTREGTEVLRHARDMLDGEQRLLSAVERLKRETSGRLLVAASTIPGEYVLPLILGEFKERFPGVQLEFEISDSRRVLEYVVTSRVETGFAGLEEDSGLLAFERVCPDTLVVVAPPGHRLAGKATVTPAQLAEEKFILREEGSATRELMLEVLAGNGLPFDKLNVEMQLGSASAVLSAVESGAGISLVSFWAARLPLSDGRISRLRATRLEAKRHFYLVEARGAELSLQGHAFHRYVSEKSGYLTEFARGFLSQ